jgi:hypothetical protein
MIEKNESLQRSITRQLPANQYVDEDSSEEDLKKQEQGE